MFRSSKLLTKTAFNRRYFSVSSIDTSTVLLHKHNPFVSEIVLNKPKALNSLDSEMVRKILRITKNWIPESTLSSSSSEEETPIEKTPKVVLLSGAGGKAFCAGGDVVSLCNAKKKGDVKTVKDFFRKEYIMDFGLSIIKPVKVAFWNGIVMGGGVGVSFNAPIKIACEKTHFAMPEVAIGLFPDVGGSYFIPRHFTDKRIGLYYALTGSSVKGEDMLRYNLATHYVSQASMPEIKERIIKAGKNTIKKSEIEAIIQNFSEEVKPFDEKTVEMHEQIKEDFKFDCVKEVYERVRKRKENRVDWAVKAFKKLESASPTSLVVTFEQIRRGAEMESLAEAFNLEGQLVSGFAEENDFFEGVRALLIDKDNAPKWKYASLAEVDVDLVVCQYFDRMEKIDIIT